MRQKALQRQTREAPTGVEPVMEVLQTSALPLGYGAGPREDSSPSINPVHDPLLGPRHASRGSRAVSPP
jgi:hypothetical protein